MSSWVTPISAWRCLQYTYTQWLTMRIRYTVLQLTTETDQIGLRLPYDKLGNLFGAENTWKKRVKQVSIKIKEFNKSAKTIFAFGRFHIRQKWWCGQVANQHKYSQLNSWRHHSCQTMQGYRFWPFGGTWYITL